MAMSIFQTHYVLVSFWTIFRQFLFLSESVLLCLISVRFRSVLSYMFFCCLSQSTFSLLSAGSWLSLEYCIFNQPLSHRIQLNRKYKQWRHKLTWIFMNFFIFTGMDFTIYSVQRYRQIQNFVEHVALHWHTIIMRNHKSFYHLSCSSHILIT